MARFDELNTVGVRRAEAEALALTAERSRDFAPMLGNVAVGLSSGTSGHRGLFLVSPADRDAWAGTVLALTLPPGLTGHRIALFLRANNALYESVRSRLVDFRYYDLTVPVADHLDDLSDYAPTILVAPPSVLRLLAGVGPRLGGLQRVYSVAEVLDEGEAEQLAAAFGQQHLHQLYQCTEGFLAHTCAHGVLHLNEQHVLSEPEWLDSRRVTPPLPAARRAGRARGAARVRPRAAGGRAERGPRGRPPAAGWHSGVRRPGFPGGDRRRRVHRVRRGADRASSPAGAAGRAGGGTGGAGRAGPALAAPGDSGADGGAPAVCCRSWSETAPRAARLAGDSGCGSARSPGGAPTFLTGWCGSVTRPGTASRRGVASWTCSPLLPPGRWTVPGWGQETSTA